MTFPKQEPLELGSGAWAGRCVGMCRTVLWGLAVCGSVGACKELGLETWQCVGFNSGT